MVGIVFSNSKKIKLQKPKKFQIIKFGISFNHSRSKTIVMLKKFALFILILPMAACAELAQIGTDILEAAATPSVTNDQAALGLKEALNIGLTKGVDIVSVKDGYFKNQAIKVLFPKKAIKVKNTLEDIPGGKLLVDNVVEKLNRAAEDAARGAKPIFLSAIRNMTIQDAMGILMGDDRAATSYLERTTNSELYNAFNPVITNSLSKVKALNAWEEIVTRYNQIPLVKKVNPSLDDYVTERAMDGLFYMVAKEEKAIRKDPLKRTSDLLKKVFAVQDNR